MGSPPIELEKKRQGILKQDAFALLGGMVSFRESLVKEETGKGNSEYKGNTIRGIDSFPDR